MLLGSHWTSVTRAATRCCMAKEPAGCLAFLFGIFPKQVRKAPAAATLPKVMVNKFFVTDAEADFFRVLVRVVGSRGHILAQVPLGKLLWFPGNNQSNPGSGTWRNKTAQKTVDFAVCHPATLKPLVAIELDEPSHACPERQTRDEQVETILEVAGLPLLHVLTSRSYNTKELAEVLAAHLPA